MSETDIHLGVSACFMYEDPERPVFSKKVLSYVESDMLKFLSKRDVFPIMIPNVEDGILESYLSKMDGFVLQGGADLSPLTYGEEPLNEKWRGDRKRDLYEVKILDHAKKHKKPLLGICRGMQMLNVYYGGSLYQDLETQNAVSVPHRDQEMYDTLNHQVEIIKGSFLEKIYQKNKIQVNSVHHQGVKKIAKELIPQAIDSKDDLVEALAHRELPHWGVQWHPEFNHTLKDQLAPEAPLLQAFLNLIRERKNESH